MLDVVEDVITMVDRPADDMRLAGAAVAFATGGQHATTARLDRVDNRLVCGNGKLAAVVELDDEGVVFDALILARVESIQKAVSWCSEVRCGC